jgi:hemerythrin superfamily protein
MKLMNAVEILTKDHREVDALIATLEEAKDSNGSNASYKDTFQKLITSLSAHMQAEEEIFYPAMRIVDGEEELVEEAYDEHNEVKSLLLQMQELEPASPEFQENLKQIKLGIEHHVSEEEGEMFPDAQEKLGEQRLQEIGQQIMTLKSQADPKRAFSA